MNIILNTTGLVFNVAGAIFFGLAFILRSKTIKEIATTKWNKNKDALE